MPCLDHVHLLRLEASPALAGQAGKRAHQRAHHLTVAVTCPCSTHESAVSIHGGCINAIGVNNSRIPSLFNFCFEHEGRY